MESDQKAIKFLASNDYDIDRAWFTLSCQLGMGKDAVNVKRASELIAKQPIAGMFHDVKEKLFKSGAHKPMLGAYVDDNNDAHTANGETTSSAAAAVSKHLKDKRSKQEKEKVNYFEFSFPAEYAQTKTATGSAGSVAKALARDCEEDEEEDERKPGQGRGQKDKSETKKRWQQVLRECCTLLQRKLENPSEKPAAGIRKAQRGSTTAAENLLGEAAQLGPFYDSPGDDFAEQLRVILGELIRQVVTAREWVAELRDMLSPLSCYHGTRRRKQRPHLYDLCCHLKKCDGLQLIPPEEYSLKNTIAQIQEMNKSTKQLFSHIRIGSEGEEEGEIPELDEILESIASNTMVAPQSQSIDWIPTMEDVSDILKVAEHLSVDIPVVTFLSKLWDKANELIYEVSKFLDRAAACRTRTKARSIGIDGKKHSLADARKLWQAVLDFPLDIGLLPALENIIETGETWQQEVQAISNQGERSKSQRQREKERDADGNKPGSASIKRVEALITEGEKSVFNFEKELDVLKDRRAQARLWLDKLKSSFRAKPKHNGRGRSVEVGADGQIIKAKMALSDMRLMVEEGADLLEDESKQSATSRELGKAQSVVDIAEEWLQRVREALSTGGTNQDLSELQELIGESDDMPVYMEEAVVLRAHFAAMEWAKKARKVLYTEPPGYLLAEEMDAKQLARADRAAKRLERMSSGGDNEPEEEEEEEDEDEGVGAPDMQLKEGEDEEAQSIRLEAAKKERQALEEAREFAYPKLSEVQKIFASIMKVRSSVPAHISEEFSLKPLIEETDTIEIVERAEAWLNASKKVLVGGVIKKGAKLKKIRELYTEASDFKINFTNELKPFRQAVISAENWIAAHADVLERLNITTTLERTVELEEDDEGFEDQPEEAMSLPEEAEKGAAEQVTYNVLQRCVIAGETLLCDFHELDAVRQRLSDTDTWILRMKEMCSKSGEEILVEKRVKSTDEKDKIESESGSGGKKDGKKDKKGDGRVNYNDLVRLLDEAEDLAVNLTKEKEVIQKNLTTSQTFDFKVKEALSGELSELTVGIVGDLHKTIKTSPEELAVAFEGIARDASREAEFQLQPHVDPEAEEDDATEHELRLIDTVTDLINRTRSISEKKVLAAKAAMSTDPIISALNDLTDQLDGLQTEAQHIGVTTPTTLCIDLCMGAMEWVDDVRELLRPTEEKKTARGNLSTKANPNALQLAEWGNLKQDTLIAMIQDVLLVIPSSTPEAFSEAYKGGLLENIITTVDSAEEVLYNARQAFSSFEIDAFQKLISLTMPASQRRVKKEKDFVKIEGAEEEEEEREEVVESLKPRVSRKRKSKDKTAEVVETQGAPKGNKRGRKGDVKVEEIGEDKELAATDEKEEQEEPEEEDDEKKFKSKFAPFKKMLKDSKNTDTDADDALRIPDSMQRLLDFYLRCLGVALVRTCEVDQWRRSAEAVSKRALNGTSFHSSGAKRCVEDVLYLLQYSDYHGYYLRERSALENEVIRFNTWISKAKAMQKREAESLLSPDDLKQFTRDGDKLIFDHPLTRDMKEECRRAKAWVTKLHATGIEKGLAKTADLQDLLPEVDEICADLSQFTETIFATTKSYCLCRQAYFGLMVGCDACDDWFHAPCIGLSKVQAERTDAFICFRCNIADSLKTTANAAATIVNKWMCKEDVLLKRENDKLRITKKLQREEKEQERVAQMLESHINNLKRLQAENANNAANSASTSLAASLAPPAPAVSSVAAAMGVSAILATPAPTPVAATSAAVAASAHDPSVPATLDAVLAAADTYQVKRYDSLRLELVECGKRAAEAKKEEESNKVQTALEVDKAAMLVAWMTKVSAVLWPTTKAEEVAGMPKGEEDCFTKLTEATDYVDALSKVVSRTMGAPLLPDAMCKMANAAISQQIDASEDVLAIVEAFRWMSWCSVLLRTLRHPPTTVALRKLVEVGKTISNNDERIIRFLQNVVLRSQVWKGKARKMLYYNTPAQPYMTNKRVDTIRANNLVLEGNQIPISSRIKDTLRIQLKNVARAETPAEPVAEAAPAEASEIGADGKRARQQTKKVEPVLATAAAAPPAITHITFHGELPDSSDEDMAKPGTAAHAHALYAQQCAAAKPGDAAVAQPKTALQYTLAPAHTLAETKHLWPVKLAAPKKELVPWAAAATVSKRALPEAATAAALPPTKKLKN